MFHKRKNNIFIFIFITLLCFLTLSSNKSYAQNESSLAVVPSHKKEAKYNMYEVDKFHYVIIGNSVTRHGGEGEWPAERGMTATTDDKDYVRVLEKLFIEDGIPDVECKIEQYFPRDLQTAENFIAGRLNHLFGDDIDLVVVQIGENILGDAPLPDYEAVYTKLVLKLKNQMKKAQVIVVDTMYVDEGVSKSLANVARNTNSIFMPLDVIKGDDSYRSFIGDKIYDNYGIAYEVKNPAIAAHPNDKGHKYIADEIHNICISNILQKNKTDKNTNLASVINNIEESEYLSSVDHLGDTTRIKKFINKASEGANLTIVGFGGSITAGAGLTHEGADIPFGEKFTNALREKYPNSTFKYVNAGISGTNLTYSVCRVKDDCINYNPDLVILDFSVNTRGDSDVRSLYSSVVSQINKANEETAIVNIHFTEAIDNEEGNVIKKQGQSNLVSNAQVLDAVVNFDIPSVTYHNFIWQKIEDGTISQKDIFQDYVHPTQYGHLIASNLLDKLFDYIGKIQDNNNIKLMKKLPNDIYANCEYITHIPNASYKSRSRGKLFYIDHHSLDSLVAYKGWRSVKSDDTGLLDFDLVKNKKVVIGLQFYGAKGSITIAGRKPEGNIYQIDKIEAPEIGLFTTLTYENVEDYIGLMTNLTEGYVVVYGIGVVK